jgi:hypothetical protein
MWRLQVIGTRAFRGSAQREASEACLEQTIVN